MLGLRRMHLLMQQRHEIAWMQTIANLPAATVKADVFQRAISKPSVDPKAKNPLIRPTKLTSAGQHATAINPDRKIERRTVFEGQVFRSKLCAP